MSPSSTESSRTLDEMEPTSAGSLDAYLIWIFVAGGAILLIAIIATIIVSWKKSKAKPETSYAEAKPVPAPRKPRTIV